MTKTLTFKNEELAPVGSFLNELNLKNKASRGRTKLIKLLAAKNEEYSEERREVLDPYFEDEKLLEDDDGNIDKDNRAKAAKVADEIESELAVIEFTEYSEKMKSLYSALSDYQNELSNQEAVAYDLLMEQLEKNFENQTEEVK